MTTAEEELDGEIEIQAWLALDERLRSRTR
jgi:hypothetical protein